MLYIFQRINRSKGIKKTSQLILLTSLFNLYTIISDDRLDISLLNFMTKSYILKKNILIIRVRKEEHK